MGLVFASRCPWGIDGEGCSRSELRPKDLMRLNQATLARVPAQPPSRGSQTENMVKRRAETGNAGWVPHKTESNIN